MVIDIFGYVLMGIFIGWLLFRRRTNYEPPYGEKSGDARLVGFNTNHMITINETRSYCDTRAKLNFNVVVSPNSTPVIVHGGTSQDLSKSVKL